MSVLAGDWLYMQAFEMAMAGAQFRHFGRPDWLDPENGGG